MRRGWTAVGAAILVVSQITAAAQGPAQASQPGPTFRSNVNLVLVDVVVRDKAGNIVRGLNADDFQLVEDGRPQQIASFAFEQIRTDARPIINASVLPTDTADTSRVLAPVGAAAVSETTPLTDAETVGRRLLVMLFDTSSMQPEDVQTAVDAANKWTANSMTTADLVAVATIGSSLNVLANFTNDKSTVQSALAALSAADGTAPIAVDTSTAASDDASTNAVDAATSVDGGTQELDTFNNDVRLRALTTLASSLAPIQQKKAILYFSSGMARSGSDNQVELRKAVNAAVRANVAIYPADARGLQTVIPGGSARNASRGGVGAFSGRAVADQFSTLVAQQETLHTLASDTGGTAFTDTNDLGDAFARITRDISAYYILGFSSTNPNRDGRFRRITVRLKNPTGFKVEAREGYYADRDFAHTAKTDREVMLREQLSAALPATDVPVYMTTSWFQLSADKWFVAISVAVPGTAVPTSIDKNTLDIAGVIRDERGLPIAQIRDTLTVPLSTASTIARRQVQYQTGVSLPPGHFSARVVVRENASGLMGTFEAPIVVPDMKRAPVKISSVVLSTQVQPAGDRKTANPLVRDGIELVPNLTHIVNQRQALYFYYEVYSPVLENGTPRLATSLTFYKGTVKVFETPVVEQTRVDATDRHASIFQFEVPPGSLKPGPYVCQVNVVDEAAERFAFPRLEFYVR